MIFAPDMLVDSYGVYPGDALVVREGRIIARGHADSLALSHPDANVHRLDGRALMPGTVNAHSHSFQSALRGLFADRPFAEWRGALYRIAPLFTEQDIYAIAVHAFAEMALAGITTVVDFFYLHHGSNAGALAVARAAHEIGLRLVLARCMYDEPGAPAAFRETVDDAVANGQALAACLQGDDLVSVIPAPHSPHGASAAMIEAGAGLAREWGTPWHMHVAESATETGLTRSRYGLTPLAWLGSLGVLDERLKIIHGVHVSNEEITQLVQAGGGLITCPGANLSLGDGICPVGSYADAGAVIALGCDSASSAGQLSIFAEMRLAALLQKGLAMAADAADAPAVIAMGTSGGAAASGLAIGDFREGSEADFVALDLSDLSLSPVHDLRGNLVYSMRSSAVRDVFVHGRAIVHDRELVGVTAPAVASALAGVVDRHFRASTGAVRGLTLANAGSGRPGGSHRP